MGKTASSVSTAVTVEATRSQAVPVGLLVLAGVCLSAGFAFLWLNPWISVVPISIGIASAGMSVWLWGKSQRAHEFSGAVPTSISASPEGLHITTDPRHFESPEAIRNIAAIIEQIGHRQALPPPDGLVGLDGLPTPNSQLEAANRVELVNKEAEAIAQGFSSAMSSALEHSIQQERIRAVAVVSVGVRAEN